MYCKTLLAGLALSTGAVALVPSPALAQESAAGVLKRASAAMGAPNTIRYAGEGTGWTFGVAGCVHSSGPGRKRRSSKASTRTSRASPPRSA